MDGRLTDREKRLLTDLKCMMQYYTMFRDGSPKGPTEQDDVESCRQTIIAIEEEIA